MGAKTKQRPKPKKIEVGRVNEAPDHIPGWQPLGHAYEGRKKPDGLGQGWC